MIPSQLRKRPDRIAAIQKDEKYRETFAGRIERFWNWADLLFRQQ